MNQQEKMQKIKAYEAEPRRSFRLSEGIVIPYGEPDEDGKQKEVRVPRVSFKEGEKVVGKIAEVLSEDTAGFLNLIGMQLERRTMDAATINAQGPIVASLIKKLINLKNYGMVEQLLDKASMGVIEKKHTDKMQFGEAVGILQYLLDENFVALKNLSASLEAIYMSVKPEQA